MNTLHYRYEKTLVAVTGAVLAAAALAGCSSHPHESAPTVARSSSAPKIGPSAVTPATSSSETQIGCNIDTIKSNPGNTVRTLEVSDIVLKAPNPNATITAVTYDWGDNSPQTSSTPEKAWQHHYANVEGEYAVKAVAAIVVNGQTAPYTCGPGILIQVMDGQSSVSIG